ncbi:MAG: hypothetical protein ACJAZW_002784 [Maritalea sp.]
MRALQQHDGQYSQRFLCGILRRLVLNFGHFLTAQLAFVAGLWVKQLNWSTRHYCRNGMFVNQLRLGLAAQQQTKIVEPRNNALQLHTIDQKNRHGYFVFPDIVKERILQVLTFFIGHYGGLFFG